MGTVSEVNFTRRDVLRMLAVLPAGAFLLEACGSATGDPSELDDDERTIIGRITLNHDHTARLVDADLVRASDLALDITGTSDHPHTIRLTVAQLRAIGRGERVAVTSSFDGGHTHRVTFN